MNLDLDHVTPSRPRKPWGQPSPLSFDATAVRARAGVLTLILGATIALTLARPDLEVGLWVLAALALDMVLAVLFGLFPLSPTGSLGTLLTRRLPIVGTPHIPKRFAWSLGCSLALTGLALQVWGAPTAALVATLAVFLLLAWLDAVLGFCVGCWIYGKLFGCQACHAG